MSSSLRGRVDLHTGSDWPSADNRPVVRCSTTHAVSHSAVSSGRTLLDARITTSVSHRPRTGTHTTAGASYPPPAESGPFDRVSTVPSTPPDASHDCWLGQGRFHTRVQSGDYRCASSSLTIWRHCALSTLCHVAPPGRMRPILTGFCPLASGLRAGRTASTLRSRWSETGSLRTEEPSVCGRHALKHGEPPPRCLCCRRPVCVRLARQRPAGPTALACLASVSHIALCRDRPAVMLPAVVRSLIDRTTARSSWTIQQSVSLGRTDRNTTSRRYCGHRTDVNARPAVA